MQGWSIMNLSFIYVLSFLILIINLTYNVHAAKFIRNAQTLTCLDLTSPPSSSSCTPVTLNSCPADRFIQFSDTLKWNLIPLDSSMPLTNNSDIMIGSNDNQFCLSTASNNVQVCPCDNGIAQKWILSNDRIYSAANNECLGVVGERVSVGNCQVGNGPTSWNIYHVAPNAVNLYLNPGFGDKPQQLFVNTYNSQFLPSEIFSAPFSLEIPPGFEFIIDSGNNNVMKFDFDISLMSPINSLTSIITVKLKPGMIIYEYPDYFSASKFMEVGTQVPSNSIIGSVLVSEGFRGVIWSNSNFTGNNLGLFEPIANFTGVSIATKQDFVASLDVSGTKCKNECGSAGFCSDNGTCNCKPGFTGEKCDQCASGFFGPTCQKCNCATGLNKDVCDDGLLGTGECKCNVGFEGDNCNQCAPGFFGINCKECECGYGGVCNDQGICSCNAGFDFDTNNQCTVCKKGFIKSGNDCKACTPGCDVCNENGICLQCQPGLIASDNSGTCASTSCQPGTFLNNSTNTCTPCDNTCSACSGPGPGNCLQCQSPNFHLEGSCVTTDRVGRCTSQNTNQHFFVNTDKNTCDACPNNCADCNFGPTFSITSSTADQVQCTKCKPGTFLSNGNCFENCPDGTYGDPTDFTCKVCDLSCANCKGPGTNECTKCPINNFGLNGVCSSNLCPSGFIALNTICTKCHIDCLECSGPGINQCTKCPPNRPILTKDGQCIEICPMGTYADENGQCQKCHADCSSCVGPNNDQCLGCSDQTKVLLGGTCSGSCPAGSELNKIERLCQLNNEVFLPPGEVNKQEQSTTSKGLLWWHILLIALGSLIFLILFALLIRCLAVKRRKQKTQEFGDQIDENEVAQNLKNMLRNARGIPSQPEISHSPKSAMNPQEVDNEMTDTTLPPYDNKDGESYWRRKQQRHQKHMSITTDDYNNWKKNLKSKDWEGFDIVTEESLSNNAGYSGYNQEKKNNYEEPSGSGNIYRNSKGSLRSNRSISTKRTYNVPVRRGDSWGENWI
ncbi:insulin-like growth factor binding protein [Glomus cerebriforme]|uniref:Insulin-like growth factor binding protein n=1 Tax=Glomus cerebriforme TaxID=658196 RepID=A0A397SMQ9_9GLOM|nr:insulin-like growth factor binding protein [Glomus cerebriforme]